MWRAVALPTDRHGALRSSFLRRSVAGTPIPSALLLDRPFPVFSAADSAQSEHALDWAVSAAGISLIPRAMRECPETRPECPTRGERGTPVHDGILQGEHSDGASSIFYWTGRRWVELPGGD